MSKKIGIFTRPIDQGTSGSGSHLEQLVTHILKQNRDFDIEFIHYSKKRDKAIYNGVKDIVIPRNPFKASKILKKECFDLLHYSPLTAFAPIWIRGIKKVATIHGAAPLFLPKQYSLVKKLHDKYLRTIFSRNMDHIFTVSKASKKYLEEDYRLAESNVSITYNAVDEIFRELDVTDREINGYNFDSSNRYIFHLSKYSTRKNPEVILRSFKRVYNRADNIKLILAGSGWDNPKVREYLEDNSLTDRVIFPGFLSREDIVKLFNISNLFLFPSFYEGFGMPNIEAMACGCPVITSNVFAIPEVVGDAALILDNNTDPDELTEKIFTLLENPTLVEELRVKGLKRVKDFSWEESANHVLKIYKELTETC